MIRRSAQLCMAVLASASLAACAAGGVSPADPAAITDLDQYPLKTIEHPDELRLAAHPQGLSQAQATAVAGLAERWERAGSGSVVVQTPRADADPRAAYATSAAAVDLLVSLGVPADRVQRIGYDPDHSGPAPVIVGFLAYQAAVPTCGRDWENLAATGANRPTRNFGCAVNANLAAQMANPADIAGPREMTAVDAGRRTVVLGKYRDGQITSSARDPQAAGGMSKVAGGSD